VRFPAFENVTLSRPEWIVASPLALSTWTRLACRSSVMETGGVFSDAAPWTDAMWIPLANVTREGVEAAVAAGLCCWAGNDLHVEGWDQSAQVKVDVARSNGRFGVLGGRPKAKANPEGSAVRNPVGSPDGKRGGKARAEPPLRSVPTDPTQPIQPANGVGHARAEIKVRVSGEKDL
jgi:hypothetical protein